ncbi:dihydroxyacetone kinase phosphoryl donor subunit DhaM [Cellulomonas fimi]|uniref:Phosphocarrier protein HPr n=1 Tax=Cellulomonas fimi (strain ATCC 484 / DSM 20113 / JCM 1341 / CCUG 24087 / LMG 16345 / NBRC 15513 / NCIMB 8980 / NCTC 7547 / NRS-133) TaxID=590998 RepID=F4H6I9_CELFA|nr:dihydroxyacetone kinase phosphoryl donor subunit DhaM [Cellulomonas fimi]AEE45622.1 dihydroxyacetone kinase, phosphotransfer subunit [Cellulomonas fimi ATCC 484]VEH30099.1 PTS-dependent dihydroxyacetone kinase, phosphotransferase subunit dhaM [Cellulomonas fimi]
MTGGAGAGRTVARVALVLVSHSRTLAEGAVELAAQMAPGVLLRAAGGGPDGGLGTSFDLVEAALLEATGDGRSAVVLTDLGSAVLTAESVLELADPDLAERVRLADAPFVEGAVAAAVAAHGGADLTGVVAAAEHAGSTFAVAPEASAGPPGAGPGPGGEDGTVRGSAVLRNRLGLHARPAAVVARLMAGFDARVLVNGVNAASVLELMKLGAVQGQEVVVEAHGPQAVEARDALLAAVEQGFGEV